MALKKPEKKKGGFDNNNNNMQGQPNPNEPDSVWKEFFIDFYIFFRISYVQWF